MRTVVVDRTVRWFRLGPPLGTTDHELRKMDCGIVEMSAIEFRASSQPQDSDGCQHVAFGT